MRSRTRKLYQQLDESRDKYLSLYQNAVEGIFEINDGVVTNINPAAAQLLGFDSPEEAARGMLVNIADWFVNAEDAEHISEILTRERRMVGYETQIKRRDNEALWVALSAQEFEDEEKGSRHIEGSIIDITERKLRRKPSRQPGSPRPQRNRRVSSSRT
ncbi:MAG: PAS domain S-box protein [Gammaproteobacteria bacterium]|nr:PAS domain S-box protein [Gammaproteobacteria bacterium]